MRKLCVMLGLILAVVMMAGAPALAAKYNCAAVGGSEFISSAIADGGTGISTIHLNPTAGGAVKIGTCGHDPAVDFQTRVTLFRVPNAPTQTNQAAVSKNSNGDCDTALRFDGKVSKTVVTGRVYHAILSFDGTPSAGDIHACIQGPVTFFEH